MLCFFSSSVVLFPGDLFNLLDDLPKTSRETISANELELGAGSNVLFWSVVFLSDVIALFVSIVSILAIASSGM